MRRIRGALGLGLTWAFVWSGLGALLMLAVLLKTGSRPDMPVPFVAGAFGFFGGILFSGVLSIAERRHLLAQLSVSRFAIWGASAGFIQAAAFISALVVSGEPLFLRFFLLLGPLCAAAGAASAAGTLALARRAGGAPLLDAGDDTLELESPGS